MRVLEHPGKRAGGKIQVTDAMAQMIGQQAFHAVTFDGSRYGCGSKVGYIEANLAVVLSRPDMTENI
jgi:UTP--glucose-1-phosphate uridylyltransferase